MNEKSVDSRSSLNMESTPTSGSENSTDRDIEKEAEAPNAKKGKDEPPKDPNLVEFDGPDDPGNPQNFSLTKKWTITILLSLLTLTITFSSSIFSTAIMVVSKQFQIGEVVGTLGVS